MKEQIKDGSISNDIHIIHPQNRKAVSNLFSDFLLSMSINNTKPFNLDD